MDLPIDTLAACFSYRPDSGQLFWRTRPRDHFLRDGWWLRASRLAGAEVTTLRGATGHLRVPLTLRGEQHRPLLHRVAWALSHDAWPETEVDHIDGDPGNNRLANLRLASRAQNARNALRHKRGLKGAYRRPDGRWFSSWWDGKRLHHLGVFPSETAAHMAWRAKNETMAGRFFNPGYANDFFS